MLSPTTARPASDRKRAWPASGHQSTAAGPCWPTWSRKHQLTPRRALCPKDQLACRAVCSSALRRMGVSAVAVATPDLTVLLVDDVLGPLTPSGLSSSRLRSRLRGKDLAYPGGAFATVGPTPAVGNSVNGRLLRHVSLSWCRLPVGWDHRFAMSMGPPRRPGQLREAAPGDPPPRPAGVHIR